MATTIRAIAGNRNLFNRLPEMLAMVLLICPSALGPRASFAATEQGFVDLTRAHVVIPDDLTGPERKAVDLLLDEVEKRTRVRWPVVSSWPKEGAVLAIGSAKSANKFAGPFANKFTTDKQLPAEGFTLRVENAGANMPAVLIVGNDARGVLFGVGKLLRSLRMAPGGVAVDQTLDLTTAPTYPIRGHQLGYRPKTNSYDAWDLATWEQYIRDLAVFGCNSVELIPPRSDDDDESPHFPLPKIDMMAGMSRILDELGLDVWIWYPAIDEDYSKPETVEFALKEWGEVFRVLPRVDAIFVPAGDPGNAPPRQLANLLEKQSQQLREIHPNAQTWISMQSYTQEWFDEMMAILQKEQPAWLAGIVHGPQTRISLPKLRAILPSKYPIRRYPDITHGMRCQYPVPDWDLAYALTEAREVINPRPRDQALIFHAYAEDAVGFITYSEGCNDDVNKFVWSGLGWDPRSPVIDILREYSRYFLGEGYADDFAQGLFALETNWRGPLLANRGVMTTLQQLQRLEKTAAPHILKNWRFQQALYRAYYDAYQRSRLIHETDVEERALEALRGARRKGTTKAIAMAENILAESENPSVARDLRARVFELAEALFQSIGMQLSVERYQAIDVGRGANLDTVDVPLNNRVWLLDGLAEIRNLDNEPSRLRRIHEILHWEDPGPGGFYDDLGNPSRQPRLVRTTPYAKDPGFLETPSVGFRSELRWRRSWCNHVDGLFQTPVRMRYENLDPSANYKIRIVYAGENFEARIRLVANDGIEVHPAIKKPFPVRPVEFAIPKEALTTGTLTLTWHANPERGGPGRGCQIAETWLVKTTPEPDQPSE